MLNECLYGADKVTYADLIVEGFISSALASF
jgi:hypothetical protein